MKIEGRLDYLGWTQHTWRLLTDSPDGPLDIKPLFWGFAERHRDRPMKQEESREHYQLTSDPESEYGLVYEMIGAGMLLVKRGSFGFTNVCAYFDSSMIRLDGRKVILEIDDNTFRVTADPTELVYGVFYHGDGNSARVPEGKEKEVCKVGTEDCCLFAACGSDGFSCLKFSGPHARQLLDRKAHGTIRATRIGNCAILGREG